MRWLIETDAFPETAPRVTAALDAGGVSWTRWHQDARPSSLPSIGERVLFWGSLGTAYVDRVAARWTPGAVGDVERFACSVYVPILRPLLANGDAVFMTVRALVDAPPAIEHVFVRPDSALKPFAARVVATSGLDLAALDHGFYYDDVELPVVLAPVRSIGREWRFVVGGGEVVTGCAYSAERTGRAGDVPDAARALAAHVATAPWQAAPLYVVDIAEVDGVTRVMELNPFSGADLYFCDPVAVTHAVDRILGATG